MIAISVLYADDDIVVIDKPAGIGVHASQPGNPLPDGALRLVQAQLGLDYLGTPQRLDAEASGVLVCGARRELNAALTEAFARPSTEQVYLAIVRRGPAEGAPSGVRGAAIDAAGNIDLPVAREQGDRLRITTSRDKRGHPAVTRYRVLEMTPGENFSLLEVIPSGGGADQVRGAEQVRAHLAHFGLPLVGDALYGSDASLASTRAAVASRPSVVPQAGRTGASGARQASSAAPSQRPGATRSDGAPRPGAPGATHAGGDREAAAVDREAAPRLGLHLYRVSLLHPVTGQPLSFTAPPPALFDRVGTGLPELILAAGARHIRRIKPAASGLLELIEMAVVRRAPLAGDPETTLYRLVNGAADGLPGLAADRFGEALVLNVYDESGRPEPLQPSLVENLAAAARASAVYVKYRQREASRAEEEALPALAPARPVWGRAPVEYPVLEEGLRYLVRPGEGWNPGIFPDIREIRGRVRAWARDRRVLNCFAYTCGFGVAAAAGGAARVANLDVSSPALERGRANYLANGFRSEPGDFLYGDALEWLARLDRKHELFDIVILDPPGFARTKQHVFSAAQNYGMLAQTAARVVAPGGLLVACCNVADLPAAKFYDRVLAGLDQAWRAGEVVGRWGAPALDYPVQHGLESHLKIIVLRLP